MQLRYFPGEWTGQFRRRFIGFDLGQRLVRLDKVAFLHLPSYQGRLVQAFA
jgi:hypothetical protein